MLISSSITLPSPEHSGHIPLGSLKEKLEGLNNYDDSALAADIAGLSSGKADKSTTLEGYGIEDAYTKTETDEKIGSAISNVYRYKGSVVSAFDLADIINPAMNAIILRIFDLLFIPAAFRNIARIIFQCRPKCRLIRIYPQYAPRI